MENKVNDATSHFVLNDEEDLCCCGTSAAAGPLPLRRALRRRSELEADPH